jgi:hypothetical protein
LGGRQPGTEEIAWTAFLRLAFSSISRPQTHSSFMLLSK